VRAYSITGHGESACADGWIGGGSAVRQAMMRRVRACSVRDPKQGGTGRLALTGFISALVAAGCLTAASAPVSAAPAGSSAAALYAWGLNNSGQLGDASTSNSPAPVPVSWPGGATATQVSEGAWTTLALGSDGNVYAWGNNDAGQLGDGSTTGSSTPVRVLLPGGVTATAVSEGQETSLAIGSDGDVYAWGDNSQGQFGDGSTTGSSTPVRVSLPGGVTATAVSEGDGTSLALGSDGNVYAWGNNENGQLGDGTTTSSSTPERVSLPGGVTATAVSEGIYTSLALGSDGNVYAWGNNGYRGTRRRLRDRLFHASAGLAAGRGNGNRGIRGPGDEPGHWLGRQRLRLGAQRCRGTRRRLHDRLFGTCAGVAAGRSSYYGGV